jgi:hypothetical protein
MGLPDETKIAPPALLGGQSPKGVALGLVPLDTRNVNKESTEKKGGE